MRRRRRLLARTAVVLAGFALALSVSPLAAAAERVRIRFEYGLDRESWYWQRQRDEQIEQPVPSPEGFPTLNQRVRIPTSRPVPEDSLPVQALRGEHEMISALAFDLASRGVTLGSEIEKFVLTLEESTSRQEMPTLNADNAKIQACRIVEFWPARYNDPRGPDAQESDTAPEYDDQACVLGKRKEPQREGASPVWTFDLTEIAQPWGADPFDNQGVMLLSRFSEDAGPAETWHVQFKIPTRDRPATEKDEYKKTRDRLVVDFAYVPGEVEPPAPPETPDPPADPVTSNTTVTPSTSFTTPNYGTGTTYGSTGTTPVVGTEAAPAEATPVGTAAPPPPPAMPAYVWVLLPAGLLALAAVRSVVFEPVSGTRPDGVIAAIRQRNVERRGRTLREPGAPMANALAAARRGLDRTTRAIRGAATKMTRRRGT